VAGQDQGDIAVHRFRKYIRVVREEEARSPVRPPLEGRTELCFPAQQVIDPCQPETATPAFEHHRAILKESDSAGLQQPNESFWLAGVVVVIAENSVDTQGSRQDSVGRNCRYHFLQANGGEITGQEYEVGFQGHEPVEGAFERFRRQEGSGVEVRDQ